MERKPEMRTIRVLIVALIGALALAACSDPPDTVDEAVSSLPSEEEVTDALANLQSEIDAVATEIENSDAADELREAWSNVEAELTEAANSIASNETIDTEAVRAELEEFQTEVEAAGDDVSDELAAAWDELRSTFEQLMS